MKPRLHRDDFKQLALMSWSWCVCVCVWQQLLFGGDKGSLQVPCWVDEGIEKAKKLRKLRDAVKALSEEEEVDRAFLTRQHFDDEPISS